MSRGGTDKEQAKHQQILDQLLQEPENKRCVDCHATAPRWASSKLGVFICMKCAGIHRSLGTHISFVRSVTLDKWKDSEVQVFFFFFLLVFSSGPFVFPGFFFPFH
eukprot:TRINITY_DN1794_c0_g2_i3.p1 TRINITY_DN1794_c0_g2~~TRINITY_DN1794_c0_g2_i3.p1  ORF type:complete len:106 (-),score=14.77 TRINITY_DN1794_c0_g2_i3:40-357(-)